MITKEYPIIGVSIDDVLNAMMEEDDDYNPGQKQLREFAARMSDEQWWKLADIMIDWLYDGDQYQQALKHGLKTLAEEEDDDNDND